MIFPSIDKLLEKVDSKYSLVIAAAKRARSIKKGDTVLVKSPISKKYVGIALEEIDSAELIIKSKVV
ncbi:MAG: DNA-directed RNA polymerase subunit omega [Vulcanibacillus sp.]